MSLLNVTGRPAPPGPATSAAWAADARIDDAIQSILTLRANMVVPLDRGFDFDVRPATVITEIPRCFPRPVVHHHLENILARLAEIRHGGRLSALDLGAGRVKLHAPWTSILHPLHRHSNRLPVPDGTPVIGCRQIQRERVGFPNRLFDRVHADRR